MGSDHSNQPIGGEHHRDNSGKQDLRNIGIVFFLNITFTIIEIIGGIWTNSIAVLADAVHDMGDSIALGIAWYFQRLSKKGSDPKYSYGYKRFSVLGALINSLILLIGSVFILTETIPRLIHPEESHSVGMMYLAGLGILLNGLAVFIMKRGQSINERVLMLHLLEDVLGWVAVLIGAILIWAYGWQIIDPILSLAIMCYILFGVIKNLRKIVLIIMQGTPNVEKIKEIESFLEGVDDIQSFHDLHIWTLDGQYHIMTVHIIVSEDCEKADVSKLKEKLKKDLFELEIKHPTIETEYEGEYCSLNDKSYLKD